MSGATTAEPLDPEEREFQRLYGAWAPTTPGDAAALFAGFERPWWISGGWAIDAFTGVARAHKDVDVTVFRRDLQPLRVHFAGRFHLWAAGSAALRPLDDAWPRMPAWAAQVWIREHAAAPWLLDVQLNPGGPRRWVFKRDRSVVRPLDHATWIAADGLRYLRPELVLAHKLRLARETDDRDLATALPLLDAVATCWLLDYVTQSDPSHAWRTPIAAAAKAFANSGP
jgi:hypothetical protein